MARIVRVHELGPPEVLRFEEIEVGAPGENEVRIRVEAIGLNRSEAMFRAGRYPTKPALPTLIGYEACGIVEVLGKKVSGFAVGDRVCALPMYPLGQYGVWGEQAIVPARCLLHAPPGLSPTEAAAVWMQYMTAYAIIEVGKAGIGDYVIIPAASSSVGLAAIQLANWAGAVPIAATRTSAKADQLRALGAAHVIATEETDLVEAVMAITDGKGARLVFDPVQGPYVQTLTSAMAERGILFIYGGLSEQPTPYPHWNMAFKGLSMRGWVASEMWNHPERYRRAREHILLGLKLGKLKPVIARTFTFGEIVEANRYLESNAQIGKIVVTM
ncbi:MAG: zinc-dependent alcohol dehydrogenase family protein [Alphaproteobacteria bacterium]|nr:zinc-dependent alcohol dehydrogenase family protein [Alphaproteobacteria bacterium]MBU0794884.1 zinc-dependent alcohol dehydrogenase family protein [Alphaproteobacteria bacterium]MBU0875513.1 zinc-dependent alcohol dehydrogenase family protein [Alphaproteobacteria bacterium]MBU1771360.1 zinc-dependent alcohol dehydrogenase family protein [Alphaproteobacteria bacterium]